MRLVASPFPARDYDALVASVRDNVRPTPTDDDLVVLLLTPGDGLSVLMAAVIDGARSGGRADAAGEGLRNLATIFSQVDVRRLMLLTFGRRAEVREDDTVLLHQLRAYAGQHGIEVVDLLVVAGDDWCSVEGRGISAA